MSKRGLGHSLQAEQVLAERICEACFGPWEESSIAVKLACTEAAVEAIGALDRHGYGLDALNVARLPDDPT